ncbi:MAG: toxin-antitoxin system TumE family protein [Betaproteobacteria bacterium]
MRAELLLDERHVLSESAFVELVVWRVSAPVRGSQHEYRYRLALVVDGECVLRYDNEAGKGDHRHARDKEQEYRFKNAEQLLADFWSDVEEMLK